MRRTSLLVGPSPHAVVVRICRGSRISGRLDGLPENLYLIEGNPQSFDDSVFTVDELEKAVVVKIADRQWRSSRSPECRCLVVLRVKVA